MTHDWLPEGFENKDVTARGRVAGRVRERVQTRKRQVKILRGGITLTALALLIGAAPALWNTIREVPQAPAHQQVAQRDGANEATSPKGWSQRVNEPTTQRAQRDGANEATSPKGWSQRVNEPTIQRAQRDGANEATSQRANEGEDTPPSIPNPKSEIRNSSPDVTLAKSGHGVELAWTGNPKGEYVVYRCTSPKFDQCSIAGVVKGTRWMDSEPGSPIIIYYRVEPNAGG